MDGSDFHVFVDYYNKFGSVISGGFGNILPNVNSILNALLIISIALTAILTWVANDFDGVMRGIIARILSAGFFVYLTEKWQYLVGVMMQSFFELGAKAGGGSSNVSQIADMPEQVMADGYSLCQKLATIINNDSGFPQVFWHFFPILICSVSVIVLLATFAWLAIEIFITIVEYKIIALVGFVLVPLNVWNGTAAFGGGILKYILAAGIKVMTIMLITTVAISVIGNMPVSPTFNFANAVALCVASLLTLILALKVPSLAQAVVTGSTALSAGAALASMTAAATAAYSGARAGSNAAGAAIGTPAKLAVAAYRAASKVPERNPGTRKG